MYNFPRLFHTKEVGRHVLPQQLPYTWSGFVWVHVVIINCHVANACVERLPVFIVLFKSADKTQRQSRSITGTLPCSIHFSPLGSIGHRHPPPLSHLPPPPPPACQYVRAARPRLVHLLQPEYIMHLIGVLQLREREGPGGGTELLQITSVHFAHCQY